jgi:hypothetical protein
MDDPFIFLALLLSILGALTSIVTTIYSLREKTTLTAKAIREASQMEFEQAMASNDIIVLGNYLYNKLGAFSVADYAFDEGVRKKVTQFLDRLNEFLGEKPDEAAYPPKQFPPMPPTGPSIPPKLHRAQTELINGRLWSSLLLIRQEIEKKLTQLAAVNPDIFAQRMGAGSLLNRLAKERLIPENAVSHLQYAITVANRGIHGIDVTVDEAQEALRSAAFGLSLLEHPASNM